MILALSLLLVTAESYEIRIPQGEVYEWNGDADSEHLEIDELVMGSGSELHLPEFKSIRIRRLVSMDAARIKIAHLSSGENAVEGADAGDGADVILFIDSIDGHIVVESKGGDGGDGVDGRHGQQGAPGGKGRNAWRFLWFYFGPGEDGYPGARGEDGEDGQDGGNGGQGGDVRIYYKEKSLESQILVEVDGGKAGRGGRAGRAGLGGHGGPGGKGSPRGLQGPMGLPGENGRPGRPGQPGASGSVSIFQVDRDFYRCLLNIYLIGQPMGECDL